MQAVVLRSFNAPLEMEERPVPTASSSDQAVVRVLACGVCHSDLHVAENFFGSDLPLVLGHEITAEDDELGNVLVYTPWGLPPAKEGRDRCLHGRAAQILYPDPRTVIGDAHVIRNAGGVITMTRSARWRSPSTFSERRRSC